jgi:hypothetical protein
LSSSPYSSSHLSMARLSRRKPRRSHGRRHGHSRVLLLPLPLSQFPLEAGHQGALPTTSRGSGRPSLRVYRWLIPTHGPAEGHAGNGATHSYGAKTRRWRSDGRERASSLEDTAARGGSVPLAGAGPIAGRGSRGLDTWDRKVNRVPVDPRMAMVTELDELAQGRRR